MITQRPTAVLTEHARQRCREMALGTKQIKRLMRSPDIVRPSGNRFIAVADSEPEIAVVFECADGVPQVITVLYRSYEQWSRS